MKLPKDCDLFLKKAMEDEALLHAGLKNTEISDSIFGFHAQQASEKLIKAVLVKHKVVFPKTHDMKLLLDLLASQGLKVPQIEEQLEWLTPYATTLRYDDPTEEPMDRKKVVDVISSLKNWVKSTLGKKSL